ncbi:MAG: EAL domain-containing protein [Polyangiaceae bacterium]|jgi:EAL domain-containing protein (putative c-di-GMP-specific phosphodiesterase class I)
MVVSTWMRCALCGGHDLFADEYVTGSTVRAPALKCGQCGAVYLDEAVARTPEERECVRLAKEEPSVATADFMEPEPVSTLRVVERSFAASPSTADGPGQPVGRMLLVDHDDLGRASHAAILRSAGWRVVEEGDPKLARKRMIVERFDVIVTDLMMPGMSGLELLRIVREYDLDVPVVLLTDRPDLHSAMAAMQYGAFLYIDKPVAPATLLDAAKRARDLHLMAQLKREALALLALPNRSLGDRAGLEARLSRALDALWVAYQPIVAIGPRRVIAYEALVRTDEPTLQRPVDLFDAAARLGRLHEVGRSIRSRVAADASALPDGVLLFVNVHPDDLNDFDLFAASSPLSEIASRVVLELTERAPLEHVEGLQARTKRLRELGFRIAVDDLGAGYAGLSSFTLLEPDYMKLDASLIRSIDTSVQKRSIVRAMLQLATRDLGVMVISEAVETTHERDTLVALGAEMLQGFLFARPGRGFAEPAW